MRTNNEDSDSSEDSLPGVGSSEGRIPEEVIYK